MPSHRRASPSLRAAASVALTAMTAACASAGPPPAAPPVSPAAAPAPPDTPSMASAAAPGAPPADARAKREQDLGISWRDFRSDEAGFAVRLPGPPRFDAAPKDGGLSVSASTGAWVFSATSFPIDASRGREPERTLDAERDGALTRVKGTLVSESKVKLGDVPGRDVRARTPEGVPARFRAFVTATRSYLLLAVMDPRSYDDAEIDAFFDSFRLVVSGGP